MSDYDEEVEKHSSGWWTLVCITILWALLCISYGIWKSILALKPNELADVLTGMVAPIGMLWVAVGVWYQRKELATALEELSQQSRAQSKQAELASETLSFQLEQARNARFREWKSVQPTFVFAGSTSGGSQGGLKFKIRVEGNPIYKVAISNRSGKAFVSKERAEIPVGGEMTFEVAEPSSENLPFEWLVTYRDKMGLDSEHVIRMDENRKVETWSLRDHFEDKA